MSSHCQQPDGSSQSVDLLSDTRTSQTSDTVSEEDASAHCPTLADLGPYESSSKFVRICSNMNQIFFPPNTAWGNARDLLALQYCIQLHPMLPDYNPSLPQLHDVYLASVPHYGFIVSFEHWSFYSQGSFYHLVLDDTKTPGVRIDPVSRNRLRHELEEIRQDTTSLDFHNNSDPRKKSNRLPMVVYNVGQTELVPSELGRLADSLGEQFKKYSINEKNCHLFAWSMVEKTVVSKHDGCIFVGTRSQIVNWDINTKGRGHSRPYSQETGYLISDTSRDISRRSHKHFFDLSGTLSDLNITRKAVGIKSLYQKGPNSISSFDPTGKTDSMTAYTFSRIGRELRASRHDLLIGIRDISQKVKERDFARIFRAPEEHRLKQYEAALISAKGGDKGSRFLLPYHRKWLSITDEEDRVLREKLHFYDGPSTSTDHCSCGARQISDDPEGFATGDIYWNKERALEDPKRFTAFLAPQFGNPEQTYHIGVAYLESESRATITVRIADADKDSTVKFRTIYNSHMNGEFSVRNVRVLGILPSTIERGILALVLANPIEELKFDRQHELYCIRMAERKLRHMALRSCPREYQRIKNDSATFVSDFLTNLLLDLEAQGLIASFEPYLEDLRRLNHIYNGSLGTTEVTSRRHRLLGETGYLLSEAC